MQWLDARPSELVDYAWLLLKSLEGATFAQARLKAVLIFALLIRDEPPARSMMSRAEAMKAAELDVGSRSWR